MRRSRKRGVSGLLWHRTRATCTLLARMKRASRVPVVFIAVVFLMAGCDSGGSTIFDAVIEAETPTLAPSPTPELRLGSATATATVALQAIGEEDGSTYVPDTLAVSAGEITDIVLTNTAQRVSHNIRISGEDGQYETDDPKNVKDDWLLPIVEAGKTGTLAIKIDTPGTYKFQCDFHPMTAKGLLKVQ